jgi:hypothetical protein
MMSSDYLLAELCGDFIGKALITLLQTLSHLVANEAAHLDVLADFSDKLLDELLACLVIVANIGLLHQASFLEELLESPVNNSLDDVLGLTGLDRLYPRDFALALDHFFRHFVTRDVLRVHRGDLHSELINEFFEFLILRCEVRLDVDLNQNTDATALVNVGIDDSLGGDTAGFLLGSRQIVLAQPPMR